MALCSGGLGLARAHRGFLTGYLTVRRDLLILIRRRLAQAQRERRRLKIYVTGHSLGGALATLALLDLRVSLQEVWRSMLDSEMSLPPSFASTSTKSPTKSPSRRLPGRTRSTGSMPTPSANSVSSPCRSPSRRMAGFVAQPPALGCYTFGAPRPGNNGFRTLFNVLVPPESFRVVARQDIIAATPPTSLGFRQVGREVWLDEDGEPNFCMSWSMRRLLPQRTRLRDHRLREYYALLGAKFLREGGRCYASPWASDPIFDGLRTQGLLLSPVA
mmetsp:Transcript_48218/g.154564  ORF Transcript_48218/g.154564 Transcript_48218/m.154564 type:complete len:273 (+) Transcript_48218:2227-3045(+)